MADGDVPTPPDRPRPPQQGPTYQGPTQQGPTQQGPEPPTRETAVVTSPGDGPPDDGASSRLPLILLGVGAAIAVAAIAIVALTGSDPAPTPPAAATTAAPAPPPVSGPVITSFEVIDDVTCSGGQASVPVSWSTRDARSVRFEVDNGPLSASYGLSGIASLPVPCDGRTHRVVLVAVGEGRQVAVSRQVNTSNSPPPAAAPAIRGFDVLDDVTCSGATVPVPVAWTTQNAQAVNFSVDGQPLPAAAGFPVSGADNIAVPCDGKAHTITLTATGTGGPAASLSRSVNTTVSGGGPTPPVTPPPLPPVTPPTTPPVPTTPTG